MKAEYTYLYRGSLTLIKLPSSDMMQLQALLSLRDRLVRQRTQNEHASFLQPSYSIFQVPGVYNLFGDLITKLKERIQRIDAAIKIIIDGAQEFKQTFELIKSIRTTVGIDMIVFSQLSPVPGLEKVCWLSLYNTI